MVGRPTPNSSFPPDSRSSRRRKPKAGPHSAPLGRARSAGMAEEEEAPAGEEAPPPADEGPSEAEKMEEMYLAAFVAVGAPPVREGW